MPEVKYRLASAKDFRSILELINQVQPHQPWTKEHFDWQYLNNPAGEARLWVAESQGGIVANYAAVPHHFKIGDGECIAWMVQDVMTHPDYRGLGIMHELAVRCTEDRGTDEFPLKYSFPNETSQSYRSFFRVGWTEALHIPLRSISDLWSKCPDPKIDSGLTAPISLDSSAVADLWQRARDKLPIAVVKTSPYLRWRYLEKPAARYESFGYVDDGRLEGLLVTKLYDRDPAHRVAHIMELLVTNTGLAAGLEALLMRATEFAVDNRANDLTSWLPAGHPYEAAFDCAGFKVDDSLRQRIVVNLHESVSEIRAFTKPGNWHLSMGDSDVY